MGKGSLRGDAHPHRSVEARQRRALAFEVFFRKKHPSKHFLTFPNVLDDYKNSRDHITCHCALHNKIFSSTPKVLIATGTSSCAECVFLNKRNGKLKSDVNRRKTLDFRAYVIGKLSAKNLHAGKNYSYSKVPRKLPKQATGRLWQFEFPVVCPKHGAWTTNLYQHYRSATGCPTCHFERLFGPVEQRLDSVRKNTSQNNGGRYSLTNKGQTQFKGQRDIVEVRCLEHKTVFTQRASSFARGWVACPRCKNSAPENSLYDFIRSVVPASEPVLRNDRLVIKPKELDIVIPARKLAVELNGVYWHSAANRPSKDAQDKALACEDLGLKLVTIFDVEWTDPNLRPRLEARLRHALGLRDSVTAIGARQTVVKRITTKSANVFLTKAHLRGSAPCKLAFGLVDGKSGKSLATMTFGRPRFNKSCEWELIRFATRVGFSVPGGASKLFSAFLAYANPSSVVSYADLRWGNGDVYAHLGFTRQRVTAPSQFWFKSGRLLPRYATQKHKLAALLGSAYSPKKAAAANLREAGWQPLYDCGNAAWEWRASALSRKRQTQRVPSALVPSVGVRHRLELKVDRQPSVLAQPH